MASIDTTIVDLREALARSLGRPVKRRSETLDRIDEAITSLIGRRAGAETDELHLRQTSALEHLYAARRIVEVNP